MTAQHVAAPGQRAQAFDVDAAWAALLDEATRPYRTAGRFAWHFARGKLGRDPVFRALLERGLLSGPRRIVDIGCGQGLLPALLAACAQAEDAGRWPSQWPAAPRLAAYTGIELMPSDVQRARAAHAGRPFEFVQADMREAALPPADTVVILDVLHYVEPAAQAALLERVHALLPPGGRLLTRVGDAAQPRGYRLSQWVDRAVARVRGHRVPPSFGRPLAQWVGLLEATGFAVRTEPMSAGTPFANVMVVADRSGGQA